jgi:putative hemolysin
MIAVLIAISVFLGMVLVVVTLVQTLYQDSLRLRNRELPAMAFFKETLEARIGLKSEQGAVAFSLAKHTTILLLGVVFIELASHQNTTLWQTLLEALLTSWLVMLLAAYIVPQLLYRKTEARWLMPLVPVLHAFLLPIKPLGAALEFFHSVVELSDDRKNGEEATNHADHIGALISAGAEEGLFEEEDRRLIEAAAAFGNKTVREVMTPRPNVVAIEASRSLEDLRNLVINEQYSRIPVYEDSIDRIIGFVHVRDMFELDEKERAGRTVRELVRPVRFVPETKPVNDLLREMQEDRVHMAVVVDEYGNTAGLATLEDLVEEILGEIRDEHEPEMDVMQDSNGGYIVAGSCDLDRLQDLFEFRPQEKAESTTVGGLIAEWLGHVPYVGESVERNGIRVEVLAANERRVEQVRIIRSENSTHE